MNTRSSNEHGAAATAGASPDPHRADLLERIARYHDAARALEPDPAERHVLRESAAASAERYLRAVETGPAYVEVDAPAAGLLARPIGEAGIPMEAALELLEREVVRPGGHPASGGHLAYIPGGGIYHAALGDYLAAATNKYAGFFFTGPGPVRMENLLVRWVADLVGYPARAAGYLASGGSIATLTAVTTARDAHGVRAADVPRAVVYLTEQAHHCVDKALDIAGLREAPVRRVPVDEGFRMRTDRLEQMIAEDRAAGLRPWLVVANAGSTDTGAVDPLDAIATIAHAAGCWYHVDAAYGGFFLLTEHGRARLRGIERSDSVVLDPHKGMFLPFGTGMLVVRDATVFASAPGHSGSYMQDAVHDPGELSSADISPELSRHFRALRMWLPLMVLGTAPFRAALEEKLLLARYFREEVQALGFEVATEPELSIVAFRWAPAGMGLDEANEVNRRIVDAMREDGRVFLSSTMLNGRFTLRLAILAFRTHRREIDLALEILRAQVGA